VVGIVDGALDCTGVPVGVPTGVDDALSTLAFLEPDLGVTLELRNVEKGVEISLSLLSRFGVDAESMVAPFRSTFEEFGVTDPASLGVNGLLEDLNAELSVGVNGFPGVALWCLSKGILAETKG
jgi:hypothetical protein